MSGTTLLPEPLRAVSGGPVYLEGRLVLSLSFQGENSNADARESINCCKERGPLLECYQLWDSLANCWYKDALTIERYENIDVCLRAADETAVLWAGAVDTQAKVILVPDLDTAGFLINQTYDLHWKRTK